MTPRLRRAPRQALASTDREAVFEGPAIILAHDASTLVHPGWTATVDEHANLVLRP